MFGNPMEVALLVGAAVLLFGADRVPKLARSIGQAKKEFNAGQSDADAAAATAERERNAARAAAEANAANASALTTPQTVNGVVTGAPLTPHEPSAPPN